MFKNCTGTQLKLFNDIKNEYVLIEMKHYVPRLYDLKHEIELKDGFKVLSIPRRGFLDNLEEVLPPEEGVIYIVDEAVALAAGRKDFVYPYWFKFKDEDEIYHYKAVAIN